MKKIYKNSFVDNAQEESLKEAVFSRLSRRSSLTVSYEKLLYSNEIIFGDHHYGNALFVGVGHGHDAIIQMLLSRIQKVDGVDPFFPKDGNDDTDYVALLSLIKDLDSQGRFSVHKEIIQDYLKTCRKKFDLIVLPDVLHHIFVTEERLDRTALHDQCVNLFRRLASVSNESGVMIISDAPRSGLRCALANHGFINSAVNYKTKGNPPEK